MKKRLQIAVSILDAKEKINFMENLLTVIDNFKKNLPGVIIDDMFDIIIHIDVMDNNFVKNTGVDLKYITDVKKLNFFADTHLMVEKPTNDKYIDEAIKYNTDSIIIHYEIERFEESLKYLKYLKKDYPNLEVGVSVNPNTDIKVLEKYKDFFSKILIMTVNPGSGGQPYIDSVDEKIKEARKIFKDKVIQIDGGINSQSITKNLEVGIDSFVIGKYLSICTSVDELSTKLAILNIIKDIWTSQKDRNLEFDKKLLQVLPNGYGEGDLLIGLSVPSIRKLASKWYKYLDLDILDYFVKSNYHEYRQFACFCLTSIMTVRLKNNNINNVADIYRFFESNLKHINNWDLTDEVAPKILGSYAKMLYAQSKDDAKHELDLYINSENMWTKRIGIVSMLTFIRDEITDLPFNICKKFIYTDEPLLQKATGWVLREIYVKNSKLILDYLKTVNKERKVPSIIMSYACEKMSKNEKEYIKD